MLKQLWHDEVGALLSAEIVLAGTILVIGAITGLTSVRDGVTTELADVGAAIGWLDQSYTLGGIKAHHSQTYGITYSDAHDSCDGNFGAVTNSRCLAICIETNPGEGGGPGGDGLQGNAGQQKTNNPASEVLFDADKGSGPVTPSP